MTSCCHRAAPATNLPADDSPSPTVGWVRLGFAGAVAAQSMIFTLAVNLSPPEGLARAILHVALAASSMLVFVLVGPPLVRAAWRPRITFEQLFLAGIFGAFAASVVSSVTGVGHVYYEVVAILLAIYTFGRVLRERRQRGTIEAVRAFGAEFERCERLRPDGSTETLPARQIRIGDSIHVPFGGSIPVDGVVESGAALVDEAPLTGAAFPLARRAGDTVLAGSRLIDGPLRLRAIVSGEDRLLDGMLARIRDAQSSPSQLEREADRLVAWFLPFVFAVAAATFLFWTARAGWTIGLFNALAVVLVACPCSMGLATPIGVWSALSDLAHRGIVPATSDLVERLAAVRQVVFDKTGTLSEESLELLDFVGAAGVDRASLLGQVAALEAASAHPVARAFRRYAPQGLASDVQLLSGIGLSGRVGDSSLRVGNAGLLDSSKLKTAADSLRGGFLAANATHEIYVLRDGSLVGIARLREKLREATRSVIADLEASGIPCTVLTGDPLAPDFPRAETGLSPLEKAARLQDLASTAPALFVGDGVNDAPAMTAAHAAFAVQNGHAVARSVATAEIHDLRAIPYALGRCRRAVRVIRQNLVFAATYNVIGIALAATGLLHPIAAALLMLASSFTVSWRALRRGETSPVSSRPLAADLAPAILRPESA